MGVKRRKKKERGSWCEEETSVGQDGVCVCVCVSM